MKPPSHFRQRAFTLVELLVSIVVLSLLTFALLNILNASAGAWSRSEQVGETLREARGAIDMISRDLQGLAIDDNKPSEPAKYDASDPKAKVDVILYGRDGNFSALVASDQTAGRDPAPVAVKFAGGTVIPNPGHGDALFFLGRQTTLAQPPDDATAGTPAKSDLCTIGYYLAYTSDNSSPTSPKSFKLYRHLQGAKETFARLSGTLATGKDILPDPAKDDVLARNVIDLKIRLYRLPPGTGARPLAEVNPWPTRVFVNNGTTVVPSAPAVVEVEFTCLGNRAATSLPSQEAWEGSARFAGLLASQKQTYKFRVHVRR